MIKSRGKDEVTSNGFVEDSMRKYLLAIICILAFILLVSCAETIHSAFFNTFTDEERSRILPRDVHNTDNGWFWIRGGNDTVDYIFLLSIEEVVRYFGDSG